VSFIIAVVAADSAPDVQGDTMKSKSIAVVRPDRSGSPPPDIAVMVWVRLASASPRCAP
jgi:hypothetical protein